MLERKQERRKKYNKLHKKLKDKEKIGRKKNKDFKENNLDKEC